MENQLDLGGTASSTPTPSTGLSCSSCGSAMGAQSMFCFTCGASRREPSGQKIPKQPQGGEQDRHDPPLFRFSSLEPAAAGATSPARLIEPQILRELISRLKHQQQPAGEEKWLARRRIVTIAVAVLFAFLLFEARDQIGSVLAAAFDPPEEEEQIDQSYSAPLPIPPRAPKELPAVKRPAPSPRVRSRHVSAVTRVNAPVSRPQSANLEVNVEGVAGPDVAHQSPPTASTASAPASSPFQVQVSPREQLPTLLYQVPPVYPLQARAAGLEGVVSLSIVVDKDGLVRDVHLVRGDPLLAPAAIEAVSRWRYKPAFLDGVPRATSRTVMVEFSLSADRH